MSLKVWHNLQLILRMICAWYLLPPLLSSFAFTLWQPAQYQSCPMKTQRLKIFSLQNLTWIFWILFLSTAFCFLPAAILLPPHSVLGTEERTVISTLMKQQIAFYWSALFHRGSLNKNDPHFMTLWLIKH